MATVSHNVLWIVTTQWRAQACGYAGDPNVRTPHLDALASRAINYTQAVTPHPFGPFARAAMLTGIASPDNGVAEYFDPLHPQMRTVAHTLSSAGYATAYFGKWHLGRKDPQAPLVGEAHARIVVPEGERGGFAFWEAFEGGFQVQDPWLHGSRLPTPTRIHGYQSDVLCDRAAAWLQSDVPAQPWFCVVSLEPPHPPYNQAPARRLEAGSPVDFGFLPNVPAEPVVQVRARAELSGYYAHIEATDAAIGRLLATVDLRTTWVVFTSVHGDMHGSHGLFRKGWPYEESVRVPWLMTGPGVVGRRCDDAVSLVDLPALTLAAAAGQGPGTVRREFAEISMPSVVRLPHQCDRVWRGWRSKDWKLILNEDDRPWLCFNLKSDPWEQRNLVADPACRAVVARLLEQVETRTN